MFFNPLRMIISIECVFAEGEDKWINSELGTCLTYLFWSFMIMFLYLALGNSGDFMWFFFFFLILVWKKMVMRCKAPPNPPWRIHKSPLENVIIWRKYFIFYLLCNLECSFMTVLSFQSHDSGETRVFFLLIDERLMTQTSLVTQSS